MKNKIKKYSVLRCSTRRMERKNQNVHEVHEDFEHHATK